jgi:hypothetical protein
MTSHVISLISYSLISFSFPPLPIFIFNFSSSKIGTHYLISIDNRTPDFDGQRTQRSPQFVAQIESTLNIFTSISNYVRILLIDGTSNDFQSQIHFSGLFEPHLNSPSTPSSHHHHPSTPQLNNKSLLMTLSEAAIQGRYVVMMSDAIIVNQEALEGMIQAVGSGEGLGWFV